MYDKLWDISLENFILRSWIYPEYSKVVCISMCIWENIKSITWEEKYILNEFNNILEKSWSYKLWWFNIYWFDIPYIWKRMIVNWIKPNSKLYIQDKKPREVDIVDVMKMRNHTSFGCSLDLLSITLLWETPKQEMDGKSVSKEFYEWNIDKIQKYCELDVIFTKRCYEKIIQN